MAKKATTAMVKGFFQEGRRVLSLINKYPKNGRVSRTTIRSTNAFTVTNGYNNSWLNTTVPSKEQNTKKVNILKAEIFFIV